MIACLMVLALVLSACSDPRPAADSWVDEWNQAKTLVPQASSVADDMSPIVCDQVLTALREDTDSLFPTPTQSLDDQVEQWLEIAKGAFFECPPASGGFAAAYEELDRLVAGIDASLELPGG